MTEVFEPEASNPIEMQKLAWQAILDNFKRYVEFESSTKTLKTTIYIAICCILLVAFGFRSTRNENKITKMAWLIGTWETSTDKGSIYELWEQLNLNELSGKSYIIKQSDTVILEHVQIIQRKDTVFYIPTVNNQNSGLPVPFITIHMNDTSMVFENKNHNFPQRISYTKITSDSIVAEISGVVDEKEVKRLFPMHRFK